MKHTHATRSRRLPPTATGPLASATTRASADREREPAHRRGPARRPVDAHVAARGPFAS